VDRLQPAPVRPAIYRPTAQARLEQLPPGHDAVLALSQVSDCAVLASRPVANPAFATYSVVNVGLGGHAEGGHARSLARPGA
jgi:hypothetical protein